MVNNNKYFFVNSTRANFLSFNVKKVSHLTIPFKIYRFFKGITEWNIHFLPFVHFLKKSFLTLPYITYLCVTCCWPECRIGMDCPAVMSSPSTLYYNKYYLNCYIDYVFRFCLSVCRDGEIKLNSTAYIFKDNFMISNKNDHCP